MRPDAERCGQKDSNRMTFFSDKLYALLKQNAISVQELADSLCLHQQHVYKIIKGQRRPTNEVLERLAESQLFSVSLAELRGWRAVDDYTDDEIIEALKAIYPDPDERRQVLEKLLKQLQVSPRL
jgi:transcriptional regulator with XRE-family HTH domain